MQILESMKIVLKANGMANSLLCNDSTQAVNIIQNTEVDVIVLDLMMPKMSGMQLLEIIAQEKPHIPVIIATGTAEIETAVGCMSKGAFDYMVKPLAKERLVSSLKRAIEMRQLRRENDTLKHLVLSRKLEKPEVFAAFDTNDQNMLSIFQYAESIAESCESVLITGDTGVGKELMAECIYKLCGCSGPFVPINIAGLDDNTFSDTLFGHSKGAFTGAETVRKGLIEQAYNGLLFLDEIGDLNSVSQVKLLRLLQEREYFPLGSDMPRKTNARFVVATNKTLDELEHSGKFRKDLFFRLCHHHIHIPPLRDRLNDLPLLVKSFVNRAAAKMNKHEIEIPDNLIPLLRNYIFPGNIRELEGMINNAVSTHKSGPLPISTFKKRIRATGLLNPSQHNNPSSTPAEDGEPITFGNNLPTLKEAQKKLILEALRRSNRKIALAADLLGITRQALSKRMSSWEDVER